MSRRRRGPVEALVALALAAGVAAPARLTAQLTGPMVPPTLPASPQPVFPKPLPTPPPPRGAPGTAPGAEASPPGPRAPAASPGISSTPVITARTQRVTVVSVDQRAQGAVLVARDESGGELVLDVASYTRLLGTDGAGGGVESLQASDQLEVTWFPEGDRRTLLTVQKVR